MNRLLLLVAASVALTAAPLPAADSTSLGYQDTPLIPGTKWHVHDGLRPQPPVVAPGAPGKAPSDAIVLFDGTDLSKWRAGNGKPSAWKVEDGAMVVPPKGTENGGDIWTREEFGDVQLHIEFAVPSPPKGSGQARGNSGVFFFGRYEFQVLDSHENPTYPDGQAGSLYGQAPPLVNASRPPGEWQSYDIIFTAPRFQDGKLEAPAYVTAFHNGVLVQHHTPVLGATGHRTLAKYSPHGPKGPIKLQDHGDPMRFRNIWARPLKGVEQ
jgi:hypothetical protein